MMKDKLKISLIQADLKWEDPDKNRNYFSEKIKTISPDVDLIILPEMFTTGFTMNAEPNAETMDGKTVIWLKQLAAERKTTLTGSIIIKENDNFYNRLLFVSPTGEIETYDKRHLFTLASEEEVYTAGTTKPIFTINGWKICPMVCYDLRFPVWSRNTEDYDMLFYVANWPAARTAAWDALLKARAIENMAYCVGVNRVGKDGKDFEYVGHSAVYDCLGKTISEDLQEIEGIISLTLDKSHLTENRKKLKFLNDRDTFTIQ